MTDFTGQWELVAAASDQSEIEFVEPTFAAEFAELGIEASDLLPEVKQASGLTLQIIDGRFAQQVHGRPEVMWYDVEGVVTLSVAESGLFDGTCTADGDRLYLIADERPQWGTSRDEAKQRVFRYDDSDTVVCDFVEVRARRLHRTMNVLTDGTYKSHILMVFEHDPHAV